MHYLKILIGSISVLFILGCGGNSKNVSKATGWAINSKKGGFQYNMDFNEQQTPPGTVPIEGGTFTKGRVQDDVLHDWNNTPTKQHVRSFYIDETEVTNMMYLEYLDWIKRVFPIDNPTYLQIYHGALPDTLVWRNQLGYAEDLVLNYLRNPAFSEYPVVGVNWLQAVGYARWRTDRVNEFILEKEQYIQKGVPLDVVDENSTFSTETYLRNPTATYGGKIDSLVGRKRQVKRDTLTLNTYAGVETGILQPSYRLPTETEWEYAALALVGGREYNNYRGKNKYPWRGEYSRSIERRNEGDQLANFKIGRGDYGGIAGWSDDGADITAQVATYPPNDFGVYDMAGNVAEWVADVYRPIIDNEANDLGYYRGNVYLKDVIGEDGKAEVVSPNEVIFDTLPNGKVLLKKLPGQLQKVPIDEEETFLRQNFFESDNRNFRDGDVESSRKYLQSRNSDDEGIAANQKAESTIMYNAPSHPRVRKDENGNLIKEYDKSSKRTTLITDEVRVYKGGSWKDRAYWLDPAQRRYLPQYIATDYIGFRCAVSRMGSKTKKGQKTARHRRSGR